MDFQQQQGQSVEEEMMDFSNNEEACNGTFRSSTVDKYQSPNYPDLPGGKDLSLSSDWQYVMRRTMQEIIPGLYLGPYAAATRAKLDELKAAGITHIICVREYLERNLVRPNHPEHFQYLVLEISGSVTSNIIPHFKTSSKFINDALASGGKVLVHGNVGISRSATLVIAFVMEKFGVTTREAYTYVQSKRSCCNPNEGFWSQLLEYEPMYRAFHVVPLPLPGQERMSRKRSLEEDTGEDTGTEVRYSNLVGPPPAQRLE